MNSSLYEHLNSNNYFFDPVFDGEIHRFKPVNRRDRSGWFIGHKIGELEVLIYGDWARNEKHEWVSKKRFASEKEKLDSARALHRLRQKVESEKTKKYEESRKVAVDVVKTCKPAVEAHPYFATKQLSKTFDTLTDPADTEENILIPIYYGFEKDIMTFQKIYKDGSKYFLPGGQVRGNFYFIDGKKDKIFVCEGFATGATIAEATGNLVVVAFNASNLYPVCKKTKDHFRNSQIIVCADNDAFTTVNGISKNVGVEAGRYCSKHLSVDYIYPTFKELAKKPTDFNDLKNQEGIAEVTRQLSITESEKSEKIKTDYESFKVFFDEELSGSVREKLSGDFLIKEDGKWQPVASQIEILRSKSHSAGLNRIYVGDHIRRYESEQEKKLLISPIKWDGVERLIQIFMRIKFKEVGLDSEICWDLFKEFCANIFRRIDNPMNQNRILVMRGNQGIGKDTLIAKVFGTAFQNYFVNMEPHEKNVENFMMVHGKLVANISEFDQTNKMSIGSVKNLITTDKQRFRMPYAAAAKDYDFHVSFISSSNFESILRDSSGNRRYIIFDIEKICFDYEEFIHPEQLLAEMHHWFETGFVARPESHVALKKFVEAEAPDNPDDLIFETMHDIIATKQRARIDGAVRYADISDEIQRVAKNFGVTVFRVQNIVKRRGLQKKTNKDRLYSASISEI